MAIKLGIYKIWQNFCWLALNSAILFCFGITEVYSLDLHLSRSHFQGVSSIILLGTSKFIVIPTSLNVVTYALS